MLILPGRRMRAEQHRARLYQHHTNLQFPRLCRRCFSAGTPSALLPDAVAEATLADIGPFYRVGLAEQQNLLHSCGQPNAAMTGWGLQDRYWQ